MVIYGPLYKSCEGALYGLIWCVVLYGPLWSCIVLYGSLWSLWSWSCMVPFFNSKDYTKRLTMTDWVTISLVELLIELNLTFAQPSPSLFLVRPCCLIMIISSHAYPNNFPVSQETIFPSSLHHDPHLHHHHHQHHQHHHQHHHHLFSGLVLATVIPDRSHRGVRK